MHSNRILRLHKRFSFNWQNYSNTYKPDARGNSQKPAGGRALELRLRPAPSVPPDRSATRACSPASWAAGRGRGPQMARPQRGRGDVHAAAPRPTRNRTGHRISRAAPSDAGPLSSDAVSSLPRLLRAPAPPSWAASSRHSAGIIYTSPEA